MGLIKKSNIIQILLVVPFLFYGFKQIQPDNKQEIEKGLKFFIDTTKATHNPNNKNFVFVVNFFHIEKGDLCYSVRYILNSAEYDLVSPNYFLDFSNEVVIILADSVIDKQIISELHLEKISNTSKEKIINKLYPSEHGGWTYRSYVYTYCKNNNGKIDTEFYTY